MSNYREGRRFIHIIHIAVEKLYGRGRNCSQSYPQGVDKIGGGMDSSTPKNNLIIAKDAFDFNANPIFIHILNRLCIKVMDNTIYCLYLVSISTKIANFSKTYSHVINFFVRSFQPRFIHRGNSYAGQFARSEMRDCAPLTFRRWYALIEKAFLKQDVIETLDKNADDKAIESRTPNIGGAEFHETHIQTECKQAQESSRLP